MAFTPCRPRSTFLGPAGCLALAALALGAGGCSPYDPPELALQEVALTDRSDQGFVVELTLGATNANEVPLPLRQVTYELHLGPSGPDGWTGRFRGTRSAEATLRAGGTQTIVLPAAIRLAPGQSVPTGLVPYRLSVDLEYITPGALAETLFDTGVRRPNVSFNKEGSIDFGEDAAPDQPPSDQPPAAE